MPDIWCDVDVALASVPVNIMPLVDDTDFKSIEDAVVYNQAGLALFWNFTTTAGTTTVTAVTPTTGGDYDWTDFTTSGMYGIEIPASGGASANNNAEGIGHFTGVATGILPWRGPTIGFRAAKINDALIDSDTLLTSLDIGQLYESTVGTVNSQTSFDMDTAIATNDNWIGQTVTLEDVSTGDTWVTWITDVVQSTDTIIIDTAPAWTVVIGDILRVESRQHPTYALNTYDPPTRAEATADTNSILSKLLKYVQLALRKDAGIASDNSTEVTAINTDEGSGSGSFDNATDSLQAQADVSTEARLAELDAANLPTDINAVKTKTDQLTFTKANEVDANAHSMNDVTVNGTGISSDLWRG